MPCFAKLPPLPLARSRSQGEKGAMLNRPAHLSPSPLCQLRHAPSPALPMSAMERRGGEEAAGLGGCDGWNKGSAWE